jgi:predicted GTPase
MAIDDELRREFHLRSNKAKADLEEFERTKVNVALIGESGSGKSSLVNALVGSKVAKTGGTGETTQEAQAIPHQEVDGLVFWDLPGCGTPNHPRETYIEKQQLLRNFDVFILVTDKRIREGDQWLYQTLHKEKSRQFFVVRTHFDNVVDEQPEDQAREEITRDIRNQLKAVDVQPYIVALKGKDTYDLGKLILNIIDSLSGWKQEKAILAVAARGDEELLQKKRRAAEEVVWRYSLIAAANGLNPIPGLDISVDLGLLTAMATQIIGAYGLRDDQINYSMRGKLEAGAIIAIRQIAKPVAEFLAKEAIMIFLKELGATITAKSIVKWVPFVGQAVAASLGYKLTSYFGSQLIDDCEKAAREVAEVLRTNKT